MQNNRKVVIITTPKLTMSQDVCDISNALRDIPYDTSVQTPSDVLADGLQPNSPIAVLFYFPDSDDHSKLDLLVSQIQAKHGKQLPVVGVLESAANAQICDNLTSTLFMPAHPSQITSRIQSVLRMNEIKHEIQMRVQTLNGISKTPTQNPSHFGTALKELASAPKPMRILFIGKPTTEFMTIMNALQDRDVEIIAAFTSFTAFDYLHSENFNGVVINSLEGNDTAMSITATMRRNSKLFNIPSLILVDNDNILDPTLAIESGINDVLVAGEAPEEIAGRIIELANYHLTHETLKSMYACLGCSESLDSETGLFNARFFEAHLEHNIRHAQNVNQPLSIAIFKTIPVEEKGQTASPNPQALNACLRQIGGMIKNIVRVHDCAARLSNRQFAIIFPGKTNADIEPVAKRIQEIINCTAFDSDNFAFQVDLQVKIMPINTVKLDRIAKSA